MTDTTSAPRNEEPSEELPPPPQTVEVETSGGDDQGFSPSSWEIIAGIVLLVAAIVIIVALTGKDDSDDTSTAGTSAPVATTPGGGSLDPTASTPQPTTLPPQTPRAPLPTTEVAADNFDRANSDSLGKAETGQSWTAATGTWGIKDNAAFVAEPQSEGFRQIAVLDTDSAYMNQGSVTVNFKNAVPGAGIVFRYSNPFNYYTLAAQPDGTSWRIEQVLKGETTNIGIVTAPSAGDVSMTVQLRGNFIDIYQGQRALRSVKTDELALAGGVGLYATTAAVEAGGAWQGITVGESESALGPPTTD